MGPDWEPYLFRALPKHDRLTKVFEITGLCCPTKTRGPMKGSPNWCKGSKATERAIYITPDEHRAWLAARGGSA